METEGTCRTTPSPNGEFRDPLGADWPIADLACHGDTLRSHAPSPEDGRLTPPTLDLDIVVIGAGPAGSAAAGMLAGWGHDVAIVARDTSSPPPLAVSVPPSARSPLAASGLLDGLLSAGFFEATGNTTWWAGRERVERFEDGRTGVHAEVDALGEAVSRTAVRRGARMLRGWTVRRVDASGTGGGDPMRLTVRTPDGPRSVRARWVVDASGRAGVVARALGLRRPSTVATTAVMARWDGPDRWGLPEPGHTLVESHPDGWVWSVPVSETRRHITVMLDPRASARVPSADLEAQYNAHLGKAPHLREIASRGRRTGAVGARRADPYHAAQYGGPGFLLAGDAASFVDPLSSFGVKKAVASGWLTAVVLNTLVRHPEDGAAALALHAARERMAHGTLQARAEAFARDAGSAHPHAFWDARSGSPDPLTTADGLSELEDPDPAALRDDPRVIAAFARLRAERLLRVRVSPGVRLVERPTVDGARVVRRSRIRTEDGFEARHLRGVDLQRLLDMAPQHEEVPTLYESYCRTAEPVILPDFLGALSVLLGVGALQWVASS